jgi:PLP dependent protein
MSKPIIVAVTKTFPYEMVLQAKDMGYIHIGENRVEEAREKILLAKNDTLQLIWHMIGHVQSRKVEDVTSLFDWVDSVDNRELAVKLNDSASKHNKTLHVLLEVNISGETGKFGFDMHEWETCQEELNQFITVIHECVLLKNCIVEGLMTMAPFVTNPEDNRMIFQSMKRLSETIRAQIPQFGGELSMGTSCDYKVAIQEGATQVRLGEALFGKRNSIV